jgi:hypothetical protein
MTMAKLFRQIGDEKVEYTEDEYAQFEIDKIEAKRLADEAKATELKKQAILDRIGLTADELKTILG